MIKAWVKKSINGFFFRLLKNWIDDIISPNPKFIPVVPTIKTPSPRSSFPLVHPRFACGRWKPRKNWDSPCRVQPKELDGGNSVVNFKKGTVNHNLLVWV